MAELTEEQLQAFCECYDLLLRTGAEKRAAEQTGQDIDEQSPADEAGGAVCEVS